MSRIGKIPIEVPKGVKLAIQTDKVLMEGPKGKLSLNLPSGISLENKDNHILVKRASDIKQNRANHGTIRALVVNMVKGVTEGYKKNLEIQGVGFKAQAQGQKLILNLGFSHPIEFTVPDNVKVKTPKPTEIEIEGVDKAAVGEIAAKIREFKPPEPYKGKGIRYTGEFVRKKQGKSVTK